MVVAAGSFPFTEMWDDTKPNLKTKNFAKFAAKHADLVLADSTYKKKSILRFLLYNVFY